MINIDDYKSYSYQNFNFLELLKENNSLVLDRIQDVFKVLGFVEILAEESKQIDEELEVIFEAGFSFFHEQLEEIKAYYNTYFNRDLVTFKKYEKLINYLLYLNDLQDVLKEKTLFKDEVKTVFDNISEEIEKILLEKKDYNDNLLDKYNSLIEQNVPVGTLTTSEIFAMIVEELAI